jgi:hypothetical protein
MLPRAAELFRPLDVVRGRLGPMDRPVIAAIRNCRICHGCLPSIRTLFQANG